MAYAAQTGAVPRDAWLVFLASVLWAVAYDTMYAMADREDDLRIGVKSTAILFGDIDIAIVAFIQITVLLTLLLCGNFLGLELLFRSGLFIALILVIYQLVLIRKREPVRCIQAFLNNHYLGMIVFIGIVLEYALAHPSTIADLLDIIGLTI